MPGTEDSGFVVALGAMSDPDGNPSIPTRADHAAARPAVWLVERLWRLTGRRPQTIGRAISFVSVAWLAFVGGLSGDWVMPVAGVVFGVLDLVWFRLMREVADAFDEQGRIPWWALKRLEELRAQRITRIAMFGVDVALLLLFHAPADASWIVAWALLALGPYAFACFAPRRPSALEKAGAAARRRLAELAASVRPARSPVPA